jgi:hypothetical protein
MPSLKELRGRSGQLFTELLVQQTKAPRARRRRTGLAVEGAEPSTRGFSWFRPEDAATASGLAFRFSALAASKGSLNASLAAALDDAERIRRADDPELIRQGLALFVTHNLNGRKLLKPRTVVAAPGLFRPPASRGPRVALSVGGLAPGLDYWREDVLANEHHQHWHEVYPYSGLPPADFGMWLSETPRADLAAMLRVVVLPTRDWTDAVANASLQQIAAWFGQLQPRRLRLLPPELYRQFFHLNDRQGELFFYMHAQMLARYDAELLSNGLERVAAFGPTQWARAIPEGYIPTDLGGYTPRPRNQKLPPDARSLLDSLEAEITEAINNKGLQGGGGMRIPIDRTNLGEGVEAADPRLRSLDMNMYGGLHNTGHGVIANLSPDSDGDGSGDGVMKSTTTAIRDQIFWRWHKHIDDLNASWQGSRPAESFDDGPTVLIRDGLGAAAPSAWASPDIILARTRDLPVDRTAAQLTQLGNTMFGGNHWDTDFTSAEAGTAPMQISTIDEFVTTLQNTKYNGRTIKFLTHEPFTYFLRVENKGAAVAHVTVRIFLAPGTKAGDRRSWIELDKFMTSIPAGSKTVIHRPDTESSVIKRPAEKGPSDVTSGSPASREESYCDCGWPYTLLLPRGGPDPISYRLMVMCTDGAIDEVPAPDHCGSMSYCGSVDRYPDTRDMGYPFARPFAASGAASIRDTILRLRFAAARSVSIRHG